jgi:hypothetical protein
MTLDAEILERPAPLSPAERDRRIAVAEAWVSMLFALAEIATRISAFLIHVAAPEKVRPGWLMMPFKFRGHPTVAWARVFRALRLALVLTARLDDEIHALKHGQPLEPLPAARAPSTGETASAVKARMDEIKRDIEGEAPEPRERGANVVEDLKKDLREDPAFYRLLNGPIQDAVAAICATLGLKPDWSLWTEDGFPTPGAGREEDWIAFFAPDGEADSTTKKDKCAPPQRPRDVGGGRKTSWRPPWPPPEPPDLAVTRPPDRPPRPGDPPGRSFRASLLGSTIIAGAPGATARAIARLGYTARA